jgi:uncharacterized protein YbaA (DUF1428 family)
VTLQPVQLLTVPFGVKRMMYGGFKTIADI